MMCEVIKAAVPANPRLHLHVESVRVNIGVGSSGSRQSLSDSGIEHLESTAYSFTTNCSVGSGSHTHASHVFPPCTEFEHR